MRVHSFDGEQVVLVNLRAQAQALALGRDAEHTLAALAAEGLSAADAQRLCLHRSFPGNSPSSIIWMERLPPRQVCSEVP